LKDDIPLVLETDEQEEKDIKKTKELTLWNGNDYI